MTVQATNLAVRPIQGEAGPVAVVKLRMVELRPGIRLVTSRAGASRLRSQHRSLCGKRIAVGILVASFATARRSLELPNVAIRRNLMTCRTILLGVLPSQRQRRASVQLGTKGVRREVRSLVTADTVLGRQRAAVELAAMRVGVAGATVIRTATRMPLGEGAAGFVTLGAGNLIVRFAQGKPCMLVMRRRHHQPGIIKVAVLKQMTGNAASIGCKSR